MTVARGRKLVLDKKKPIKGDKYGGAAIRSRSKNGRKFTYGNISLQISAPPQGITADWWRKNMRS
jgi:hypothetical protein